MKILHITTSLSGGAGLCAKRIIKATRELGIDARALFMNGNKDAVTDIIPFQYSWSKCKMIRKGQSGLNKLGLWPKEIRESYKINKEIFKEKAKCDNNPTVTPPITIYKQIHEHPWVKEADLIHLQWIGNFVDYPSFFANINKPIVWTLHDENPGLGGFHYTSWKEKAPKSFQLLDDKWMAIKEKAYKSLTTSMTIVAISKMMEDYICKNRLLKSFPHVLIHNGIDINAFKMLPQKTAREVLSIPVDNVVFLFSAYYIHEDRKGLKELIAALSFIKNPNITLICLGNYLTKPNAPFNIRCEGFVSNNQLQSIYYSAADYFVMPSFQEAFAQTPLEAMSCGTPVISFPCSGARDLINENNGIVCDQFTVDSFSNSILQALKRKYDREEIRNYVSSHYSYNIIAKQYANLYQSILS